MKMMSLCKTVHNLLSFPDPDDRCRSNRRRCKRIPPPSNAAGLRYVAGELPSPPPHVVESAAVGPRPPLSPSSSTSPSLSAQEEPPQEERRPKSERIDDGTRGLSYLYGRNGGSLELCTESLGFESCCDGRMGEEEERAEREIRRRIEEAKRKQGGDDARCRKARPTRRRTEARELPPPLPSLSAGGATGGRCSSFLKAVRKDGRFVLTQFWVERPEVFRASREGGRLRLELVKAPEPESLEEEEETSQLQDTDDAEKEVEVEEERSTEVAAVPAEEEGEVEVEKEAAVAEEQKQQRWQLPAALDRRRCQELVRQGLPSSPFWGNRFVTTA